MPIFYYLFIKPLSLLPYSVLYFISDGLYYLFFYLIKYRKKVVVTNLTLSFPNKSKAEIHDLSKKFYRHFMDLVVESIKCFSITENQINARFKTRSAAAINRFFDEGKSIIVVGGHYNNWEMYAMMMDRDIKQKTFALYTPLTNKYFDKKMRTSRSKYGLNMISIKLASEFLKNSLTVPSAFVFGSDQSPSNPNKCYWTQFLNQETGVHFGVEKYAKEFNIPVFYGSIQKIKRGFYEVNYQLVTDNPNACKYGEITERHVRLLEKDIVTAPQYWLWSHRRWKHKKPVAHAQ
jgi:Kdo2-lipid IVA lauroyltransferase/acyltransferase